MSGSRSVITPSWLSGSWRSFLYSSSVYSYHLFLISSASVRSISYLSFIKPIFAWNIPLVSLIFLKRSLVFPILLFSSISLPWSLRKAFLSLLAILWNSAFRCLYYSFSPLLFASVLFFCLTTKWISYMDPHISSLWSLPPYSPTLWAIPEQCSGRPVPYGRFNSCGVCIDPSLPTHPNPSPKCTQPLSTSVSLFLSSK